MAKQTINVPDIGGAENVDVIEVCVGPGDMVNAEDSLVVLESDKASMDIPSPAAGKVLSITIKEGDQVSEGAVILELDTDTLSSEGEGKVTEALADQASPMVTSHETSGGGASQKLFPVPDIGGSDGVDVIEICVAVGDVIAEGDSVVVLESDKASMEVPSPVSGKVISLALKEGDKVSEGDDMVVIAISGGVDSASEQINPPQSQSQPQPAVRKAAGESSSQDFNVPDIGGSENVDVIEVCVAVGDAVAEGDSILVLESDKASMEVPAPATGTITTLAIKEGDKVSAGSPMMTLTVAAGAPNDSVPSSPASKAPVAQAHNEQAVQDAQKIKRTTELHPQEISSPGSSVYAGPAVRKLAREMAVHLHEVPASGPKGRISKDDVKAFVKSVMQRRPSSSASPASLTAGAGIPAIPEIDFSKFGDVEKVKMSKIHKLTALNMTRNWLNVPHVTQFDDADITDLEDFRKGMKAEAEKSGVKLTPLPFLLKACAAALKYEPSFNVSMHADGEHIVKKSYVNIGIAVATPNGLMVPVVKDVDKKGLYQLAEESNLLAKKARDGKLLPKEMQGGCFTISSLGAIGGTGFTPIVNAPEVAILGVSKASIQPVWNGKEFMPRQLLPLCLSYDHRAINGADAGRFFTYLTALLSDVRRLSL